MFSDSDTTSTGFPSKGDISKESEDASVQTVDVKAEEKDVQTKDSKPVGIQTHEEDFQSKPAEYNESKLAAFLSRICPAVLKELDRASQSNAFASYALSAEVEDEMQVVASLLPGVQGVKVSDLSWSCTGSVLAVGLSHSLHTSWCSHQGTVQLYNVDRDIKVASRTLEVASCVRSVSMHPYLSSILAVGTTSGEVVLWDVAQESSDAMTNATRTTHSDSITRVRWVLGTGSSVTLASSALDGHIFLWKVSPQLSSYQVVERYKCDGTSTETGITCFAFPLHQQDTFVVALEGGALLHCSTAAARPIASVQKTELVKDPTVSCFEPQPATVTCIEFSSHSHDIFATTSIDEAIRIYSLYQSCAQRVLWGAGVAGVAWTPAQADLLAGWGDTDSVNLFHSQSGETLMTFTPGEADKKSRLSAVAFNTKSIHLVAVGNLDGVAQVWKIPTNFQTKSKRM